MVKSGSERSAKYTMKYDAYVAMLRAKLERGQAIIDFINKGSQANYLLDSNIAQWLQEFPLAYGQIGSFYDMVKSVLSRWDMLTETDKANLLVKWLAKGFPIQVWNRLAAKHDELTTFQLTHKAPNIQVKYEADMFPYPSIAEQQEENLADSPYLVNPVLDFQLDYEIMPSEKQVYVQNYWRQQNIKKGSCDFNYNWTDAKMDKTLSLQTIIDNLEPLRVDKTVSLKAELLDLLTSLGCVGYWRLDETSGTIAYDDTINHNDANNYGATIIEGVRKKALSFDGITNFAETINNVGINGNQSRTLAFWCKVHTIKPSNIVGWGSRNLLKAFDISIYAPDTIHFYWYLWGWIIDWNTFVTPNTEIWEFHIITFDGVKATWEINCVKIAADYPIALNTDDSPVFIGRYSPNPLVMGYANVDVDEIMIFNRILSEPEKQAIMNFETQLFPDRAITLNVAHETESGTAKSSSKTENLQTQNSNTTLASATQEKDINVSYDTEVT